ncbi:MAG: hypothetical protein ACJ0OP_03850 [Thermodesulfobacteriota bacterium]
MIIDVSQKYQEFKEEFTNYSILNKKDALLLAVSKKKTFCTNFRTKQFRSKRLW